MFIVDNYTEALQCHIKTIFVHVNIVKEITNNTVHFLINVHKYLRI